MSARSRAAPWFGSRAALHAPGLPAMLIAATEAARAEHSFVFLPSPWPSIALGWLLEKYALETYPSLAEAVAMRRGPRART